MGTFWYPLFTGLHLSDRLSKSHFLIIFLGVNVTFFPQHFLGLQGMPRRYSDYADSFSFWNKVSSLGAMLSTLGAFFLVGILWHSTSSCSQSTPADSSSLEMV